MQRDIDSADRIAKRFFKVVMATFFARIEEGAYYSFLECKKIEERVAKFLFKKMAKEYKSIFGYFYIELVKDILTYFNNQTSSANTFLCKM